MIPSIKTLVWLVVTAFVAMAVGFVMMAIDGYDFWDVNFPIPNTLAETGFDLATAAQVAAAVLLLAAWIVFSIWTVGLRDRIPTTWKHSKPAIWLWWFVPVAWYWMPREVYREISLAALPSDLESSKRSVDRWWLSVVAFVVASELAYLGSGPWFLAGAMIVTALLCGLAAFHLGRLVSGIAKPEVTFQSTPDRGDIPLPIASEEPTVPGWYNDPSGQATHQAYWDGGRYTGAVRPDPRLFPTQSQLGAKEKDQLRTWLIAFGIVFTVISLVYSVSQALMMFEEEGGFDIASFVSVL